MKKKLSAIALTAILVMALGVSPVFAAGSLPTSDEIEYIDIVGNDSVTTNDNAAGLNEIPVFGYIGPDADIDDPDPEDPKIPPVIDKYEINVSVPVKIFWAAFESSNGAVTAPDYKIKNNSTNTDGTNDVEVKLLSFEPRENSDQVPDTELTLNLTGDLAYADVVSDTSQPVLGGGKLPAGISWLFSIDGSYIGSYNTVLEPIYDMILEFSV
jgi:hypothetical protein